MSDWNIPELKKELLACKIWCIRNKGELFFFVVLTKYFRGRKMFWNVTMKYNNTSQVMDGFASTLVISYTTSELRTVYPAVPMTSSYSMYSLYPEYCPASSVSPSIPWVSLHTPTTSFILSNPHPTPTTQERPGSISLSELLLPGHPRRMEGPDTPQYPWCPTRDVPRCRRIFLGYNLPVADANPKASLN